MISLSLSPSPLPINISPLDLSFNFRKSASFSMGNSVPGAAAWPVAPASATAPAPAPQRRRPGPRCPEGPGGLRASASWSGGSPRGVFFIGRVWEVKSWGMGSQPQNCGIFQENPMDFGIRNGASLRNIRFWLTKNEDLAHRTLGLINKHQDLNWQKICCWLTSKRIWVTQTCDSTNKNSGSEQQNGGRRSYLTQLTYLIVDIKICSLQQWGFDQRRYGSDPWRDQWNILHKCQQYNI